MNTTEVATRLGTTPRRLRQFLRSKKSTYAAVGSTQRYEFEETELAELERRFQKWAAGKVNPEPKAAKITEQAKGTTRRQQDHAVWQREGLVDPSGAIVPLALPSLKDPTVLARVRRIAAEQEARLEQLLLARGMHISQGWVSSMGAALT